MGKKKEHFFRNSKAARVRLKLNDLFGLLILRLLACVSKVFPISFKVIEVGLSFGNCNSEKTSR